jgi:tRNA dimethylallyltransferase
MSPSSSDLSRLPFYVSVSGPTASGKTSLALALAKRISIEIISVDSALIYRGMDIGTAKPSGEERQAVIHHLIDIRDPAETYSAAQFAAEARDLIVQIHQRGRLPVLVGGTMLYFKALWEGLDDIPATTPSVRQFWQAQAAQKGWPALHQTLMEADPLTAQRLAPHDAQRIGRALEVMQMTGRPLSSFWKLARSSSRPHTPNTPNNPDSLSYPVISLEPSVRSVLHERIEARVQTMWQSGLWQEVCRLYQNKQLTGLESSMPSMRCVAYRQIWAALETLEDEGISVDFSEWMPPPALKNQLHAQITAATRQLAKRQLTWLRSWPHRRVVACDEIDFEQRGVELILNLLPSSFQASSFSFDQ